MTQPSTGSAWTDVYGYNPLGIRKGIIVNVLIRDYLGASTNLRDTLTGLNGKGYFTPYAVDGLYRGDLTSPTFPGGQFYDPGALSEDGIKITPDVSVEGVRIAQARRAQRWDVGEENDEIMWVCRESNPVVDALRFDLPLSGLADSGSLDYTAVKPMESNLVERQVIAFAEDGRHRFAYIFPRVARKSVGESQLNRQDPDDLSLTYGAIPCPFADTPVYLVRDGEGWRGQAGSPIWSATPVATKTGTTTATVAFTAPRLLSDPQPDSFIYTVERRTGTAAFASATVGTPVVNGSSVTLPITGLTTATSYTFRVTAKQSANSLASVSAASNSVTTD